MTPARALGASLLALCLASPARADYTTTVDPGRQWGTWDGWGCSLAWWANVYGGRDDVADLLFTLKDGEVDGQAVPGLGLNIVRYNAGASSRKPINGGRDTMAASPNIPSYKQIEGYWLDWRSTDPASASWDWSRDAAQREMLLKARERGADWFELFSNSPMWWMLKDHDPSGARDGGDNLQKWNYRDHAVYLATIAKKAHDDWGIDFNFVEPFNEPTGNKGPWDKSGYFWKADGGQEGCSADPKVQSAVIGALREELDARGLTWVGVSASDENTYDEARGTWEGLDSAARSVIGKVNVHGYQYGGGRRDALSQAVGGRRLWNSEYGDGDPSGMSLASNLNLDFRWLHPSAWNYWQPLDPNGDWTMLKADFPKPSGLRGVNAKYFVWAQYTRHIRPGMLILDGGEDDTVAAYSPDERKLVLVTANYGAAQRINYDLSRFGSAQGPITRWATNTAGGPEPGRGGPDPGRGGGRYARHQDTELRGARFGSWFEKNTVQTFEIENVSLP